MVGCNTKKHAFVMFVHDARHRYPHTADQRPTRFDDTCARGTNQPNPPRREGGSMLDALRDARSTTPVVAGQRMDG